jgi:hypothetical protein
MKNSTIGFLLVACTMTLLLLVPGASTAQTCDQTVSVGANLPSLAAASPAASVTICLNSGNYGSVNFNNIARTAYVTFRSLTGQTATLNPQVGGSSFIKFQSLTLSGAYIHACASNIQMLSSTYTAGLLINNRDGSCAANRNYLIDGNTFGDIGGALYEGRLSVADRDSGSQPMGLTISNNRFGPGCKSDGIQYVGQVVGTIIGPGNTFDGILQSGPVHCDMIQFYSGGSNNVITGNWFRNGSVVLTHHTATPSGTIFSNNIISNVEQLQVGQSSNFVFEHNTVYNLSNVFTINSNSTNAIVRNNIFAGSTDFPTFADAGYGPCISCTATHNLCPSSGSCGGSNQIIGTPKFTGGSPPPSTWSGWQLATTSLGRNAGTDGLDVGIIDSGSSAPNLPPLAPTNLLIH